MARGSMSWASLVAAGLAVTLSAQAPSPTFEVASVKKQSAFIPPTRNPESPDAFRRINATVASLVQFAYGLRSFQVIGGPEWARKDYFEVNAKAPGAVSTDQMRLMVRSLLAERFKLVVRKDQQDMRSYLMVVAREDGRVGPKLARCENPDDVPTPTPVRVPPGSYPFNARCVSSAAIASAATGMMGAPVVDGTGLAGLWTFQIFPASPDPLPPGRERDLAEQENVLPFPDAMQQELGLRLESRRGPVDVLVIESVQQPTEN